MLDSDISFNQDKYHQLQQRNLIGEFRQVSFGSFHKRFQHHLKVAALAGRRPMRYIDYCLSMQVRPVANWEDAKWAAESKIVDRLY